MTTAESWRTPAPTTPGASWLQNVLNQPGGVQLAGIRLDDRKVSARALAGTVSIVDLSRAVAAHAALASVGQSDALNA